MKTIPQILLGSTFALLAAGLLFQPATMQAQGKGAATKQLQLTAGHLASTSSAASSISPAMACPKCGDANVTVSETTFKGTQLNTSRASTRHLCPSCSTKITVAGHGKAMTDTVNHACSMSVATAPTCCAMK